MPPIADRRCHAPSKPVSRGVQTAFRLRQACPATAARVGALDFLDLFDDERLGQGRQNAAAFLREHPEVSDKIAMRIQTELGEEGIASARLLPIASAEDAERAGKKAKEAEAVLEEVAATG